MCYKVLQKPFPVLASYWPSIRFGANHTLPSTRTSSCDVRCHKPSKGMAFGVFSRKRLVCNGLAIYSRTKAGSLLDLAFASESGLWRPTLYEIFIRIAVATYNSVIYRQRKPMYVKTRLTPSYGCMYIYIYILRCRYPWSHSSRAKNDRRVLCVITSTCDNGQRQSPL